MTEHKPPAAQRPDAQPPATRPPYPGRTQRVAAAWIVVLLVGSLVVHIATSKKKPSEKPAPKIEQGAGAGPPVTLVAFEGEATGRNPLNAERAMGYLEQICALGPRWSGSPGMAAQQQLVEDHFRAYGADVWRQEFRVPNPLGGPRVNMANIVARYRGEAADRVLLCAHYDTRPLPDQDPNPVARRRGRFVGANDGASGVAVLMELAHLLSDYDGAIGVDLALFDGEELVYRERRDPYFLGSQYFARRYAKRKRLENGERWRYRAAVLLDMVGDADLQLYQERYSYRGKETRAIVQSVWATAERLGVREFIPQVRHAVRDDHLALQRYGNIAAIDIIDFDYPAWHTEADTPRKCSGDSLAKVGWVVWEWLLEQEPAGPADSTSPEQRGR